MTLAGTGPEALATLAREPLDVVVLDVMLPAVDGTEVCRRLRSCPEHDQTAVVTLTALPLQSPAIDDMISAGSDTVLIKPCPPADLLTEIQRLLQRNYQLHQQGMTQRERSVELRARTERLHQRVKEAHHTSRELLRRAEHLAFLVRTHDGQYRRP